MSRTCPKCGTVNDRADFSATERCPKCDVVYSKATVAIAQQRAIEEARHRAETARENRKPAVERAAWLLALIGGLLGLVELGFTFANAESAPQQGAGAALALALAVIPYCIARALQLGSSRN